MTDAGRRIEELETEARYQRERYELYKAKRYGRGETSEVRLRELERLYRGAQSRLRAAREEAERPPSG